MFLIGNTQSIGITPDYIVRDYNDYKAKLISVKEKFILVRSTGKRNLSRLKNFYSHKLHYIRDQGAVLSDL